MNAYTHLRKMEKLHFVNRHNCISSVCVYVCAYDNKRNRSFSGIKTISQQSQLHMYLSFFFLLFFPIDIACLPFSIFPSQEKSTFLHLTMFFMEEKYQPKPGMNCG